MCFDESRPAFLRASITKDSFVRVSRVVPDLETRIKSEWATSTEARTASNVKEMILKTNATDMDFFRTLPYYYRSIPTPLSQKLVQMNKELKTREEIYNEMKPMRNMKFGMLDGQTDVGYISVGLGISMIHSIRSCKEIIDDITQDFKP